jgi:hypothetical protein
MRARSCGRPLLRTSPFTHSAKFKSGILPAWAASLVRFVVSTRSEAPKDLYESYARRGEGENWIKDFKLYLKADRLSCRRFIANQFRLLLHAAYRLMDALRRKLIESGLHRMQLDTLRLRLVKVGGSFGRRSVCTSHGVIPGRAYGTLSIRPSEAFMNS